MAAGQVCPNRECLHPAALHDMDTWEDPRPMCCVEGCACGKAVRS